VRNAFLIWALLVLAAPVRAAVIYVDASAPGPVHDGTTWSTACTSLSLAASASPSGAEFWVARGAYAGPVIVPAGRVAAFYGGFAGGETSRDQRNPSANTTTVIGKPYIAAFSMSGGLLPGAVVDGFHIEANPIGIDISNGGPVVANNVITGGPTGINYFASAPSSPPITIRNNRVSGASRTGISVSPKASGVISGNVIEDCGIGITVGSYYEPIAVQSNVIRGSDTGIQVGGAAAITNNTVVSNVSGVTVVNPRLSGANGGAVLGNNVIAYNLRDGISGPAALSHNDVYQNGINYNGLSPDPSDLSVPPLFPALAGGDVHIQPASPLRNAGDGRFLTVGETDTDGQPRVQEGVVDIGADESDGTLWPVGPENIVRVRPGGSDAADGRRWETAKATIAAAMNAAPGAEVWIAAGQYPGSLVLARGVSLYGGFAGTETERAERDPTVNVAYVGTPSGDGLLAGGASLGCVVDGLALQGYRAVFAFGADLTISHCSVNGVAPLTSVYSNLRLTDCVLRGHGGGVSLQGGSAYMTRNVISVSNASGLHLEGGDFSVRNNIISATSAGIEAAAPAYLLNNTIISSNPAVNILAPGITMANNLIAFNLVGVRNDDEVALTTSHNDVVGSLFGGDLRGATDISVDPVFADPRRGDYHIQPDSRARNAGDNAYVVPGDLDMDGQLRIQDGTADIGADESDGTAYHPVREVVYVKPGGSPLFRDGRSWETALSNLGDAMSLGHDEDVWVAAGTYKENITLPRHVAVYGGFTGTETDASQRDAVANVTVIDGSAGVDAVSALESSFAAVVDGFTIRGGSGAAVRSATALTVEDNRITTGRFGVQVTAGSADISRNTITNPGFGVYLAGGSATVHDNLITGGTGDAIFVNRPADIWNNTIAANQGDGALIQAAGVRFRNNIVAGNGGAGVTVNFGAPALGHNLFFGNIGGDYHGAAAGDGDISADPLFVDAATGNFHLQSGSPTVEAGDDSAVRPGERDLDGKPRILGAHVDIGAFTFGVPAPPTMADAAPALRIAAGLTAAAPADAFRLNADPSDRGITLADAVAILLLAGAPAD
jgi:hypothetical protein